MAASQNVLTSVRLSVIVAALCKMRSRSPAGLDPRKATMQQVYEHFGLDNNTADFVGHALMLYKDDEYVGDRI